MPPQDSNPQPTNEPQAPGTPAGGASIEGAPAVPPATPPASPAPDVNPPTPPVATASPSPATPTPAGSDSNPPEGGLSVPSSLGAPKKMGKNQTIIIAAVVGVVVLAVVAYFVL